jgi:hypothetical protein
MRRTGNVARTSSSTKSPLYIVISDLGQVWTGIRGDELAFSDNWDDAKPLENDNQFSHLEKMTYFKLEKLFL